MNRVVRIRVNDQFVWVGEIEEEDAVELQLDGRSIVCLVGTGEVVTWDKDGSATTTTPEGCTGA